MLTKDIQPFDGTYLSDLAPLALTSEASLELLNENMISGERIPMDRFRSNIVMSTENSIPFLEDEVTTLQIGKLSTRVIGPTFRCVIPSVNQHDGEAGFRKDIRQAEPIATLKKYRSGGLRFGLTGLLPITMGGSKSLAPLFGVYLGVSNARHEEVVHLGDPIKVTSY